MLILSVFLFDFDFKMKVNITLCTKDNGTPPKSSTLDIILIIDPSLQPTSKSALNRGFLEQNESDRLTNIYLIIFITFGVSISFIILVLAICCMAKSSNCGGGGGGGESKCLHCTFWKSASSSTSSSGSSSATSNHKVDLKVISGDANGDFYNHQANLGRMPDRCATMTFSNEDYTIGSNSFTLDKNSPARLSNQKGTS